MPTIIAICPYCRAGGIRAAANDIGATASCPKCKSSFIVLPEEKLPDWAANAKPHAESFSAPTAEKPKLPVSDTHSTVTVSDQTKPTSELLAEEQRKTKKTKEKRKEQESSEPGKPDAKVKSETKPEPPASPIGAHTPVPVIDTTQERTSNPPADIGMVCALLALILVGPTVLASQLPYGRFIALSLATIGLIGGLISLGSEGKARLAAGGAAFLHFVMLMVVLFLPSWLNLDPWGGASVAEEPKGPTVIEHGTNVSLPLQPLDWIEASRNSWAFKDARVTLRSSLGPVDLTGPNKAKRTTKERYLQLIAQVTNTGVSREIPLSGWAAGQGVEGVHVVDSTGRTLTPATFDGNFIPNPGRPLLQVPPGQTSEIILIFAPPTSKSEVVRVQLPGAAVGATEEIKFRIGAMGFLPHVAGTPGK